MNKKKICFICCANDFMYEKECRKYLEYLYIPEGIQMEIKMIYGAKSMTAGYNQGIRESDAKYKVYLHQDVLVWNRHFIYDMLEIFENSEIGMFGVLGGNDIPDDGIFYSAWNVGMTYACDTEDAGIKQGNNPKPGTCQEVEAIDGMLMATQYDISWREDLFDGWDFYDISQSFEFRKQGYIVVVPYQREAWCMHDCGRTKLWDYNQGRRILLKEYSMFFKNPVYRQEDLFYNKEWKGLYDQLKAEIIRFMIQGNLNSAVQCCEQYDDRTIMDSDLSVLKKIVSVCAAERQLYGICRTWTKGEVYESVRRRYHQAKFQLWNAERNGDEGGEQLKEILKQDVYSMPLLVTVGLHNTFCFEKLFLVFLESVKIKKKQKDLEYLEFIANQITCKDPIPFKERFEEARREVFGYNIEEKIAEIEQKSERLDRIQKMELQEYRRRINHLLKEGKKEELSRLLSSKEFCEKFETVTDMVYMILLNQIYQEEVAEHAVRTVLDRYRSIEEIVAFIQEIKFGLWRLEFDMEERAGEQFMELVCKNQISGCLLKYAVYMAGMDKMRLLLDLAVLFLDRNMFGKAFVMLKYANELSPGTEEILCTMADLCLRTGKKEEALYCLDQIEHPTQIAEIFRKLCES